MTIILSVSVIVIAYLLGSIPVGYLMARLKGVDLLHSGSGRTGSTNVLRSAGLVPATFTILGDALKGLIPTYLAVLLYPLVPPWVAALTGVAAVMGHNYSIYLKFRGGVGAITALGSLLALSLPATLVACGAALVAILISRYASVASFTGSVTALVMLVVLAFLGRLPWGFVLYGVLIVAAVSWALRPNFARIRAGTERKIGVPEKEIKTI